MIEYIVRPCSSKAAFEIILDRGLIASCIENAKRKGFSLIADTPHVKIFRREIKLSFFKSGKILVEGLSRKEEVEDFFRENLT